MRERVLITGIGCLSSFGLGHEPFLRAILAGASGIAPITAFDSSGCRSHTAATIQHFDPAAFIAPMKLRRVDEVGRIALAAARLALEDAGWPIGAEGHDNVGVALGTYTAGLDSTVAYLRGLLKDGAGAVPALLFSNTVSNAPASLCAIEYRLRGPNATFNQREASSLAALTFAAHAVAEGRVPAMLAGGADRIEEVFFKVHDRFHALSPKLAGGEEAARPFDRRRNGFVLGEGAFLMLLEAESSASARGARVYGELLGSGATASKTAVNAWPAEPAGIARAMQLAIDDAGVQRDDVRTIFASADGSPDLDRVEAEAIAGLFGSRAVPVASIKGAIGESGASGAAAVVSGLLALANGAVPPTAGWAEPDPACPVDVSAGVRTALDGVFLVNSIASGGTNYCVALR